ncbi:myoD family inhibitor domain-containing protein-like isoform X2 [Acipenser ruthenus]|uniref:myoD family inhibitor domain-containing protein-like isoform X2 n=1 Tax=Acipenser ruthenus TaxID=7906 RepID=UPI002741D1C2|nr:myoD family inhibitor domain-containing protein-like isoform X2 [Acipenser ruthenus]
MASQNPDKDDSKETIGNIEESSLLSNGNVHQSLNEVPLNGEPVNELRDNDKKKKSSEESNRGGPSLSLCLMENLSVVSYAGNGNSQFQPDNGDYCTCCEESCLDQCCMTCEGMEDCCCLDICSECCGLCFNFLE